MLWFYIASWRINFLYAVLSIAVAVCSGFCRWLLICQLPSDTLTLQATIKNIFNPQKSNKNIRCFVGHMSIGLCYSFSTYNNYLETSSIKYYNLYLPKRFPFTVLQSSSDLCVRRLYVYLCVRLTVCLWQEGLFLHLEAFLHKINFFAESFQHIFIFHVINPFNTQHFYKTSRWRDITISFFSGTSSFYFLSLRLQNIAHCPLHILLNNFFVIYMSTFYICHCPLFVVIIILFL